MSFILGYVITFITFPGVILHEIAHRFFCDITGTPVYEVQYFEPTENPPGYVIHREASSLKAAFLISMGPLLINTLVCIVFCFPYAVNDQLAGPSSVAYNLLGWIGISAGMHAFPSNQDATSFSDHVKRNHTTWLYIALLPFRILIFLANILRIIWFDLFYAIGVATLLPKLILWLA